MPCNTADTLQAFDKLRERFPSLGQFRGTYSSVVTELRPLFTVLTPYERPTKSRELHPFVQTNFPEIRRDKFDEGVELDREEFARRALR